MVDAINSLKKKYPDKRWGYYAVPNVPIWICADGGDTIRHETCTNQIRVFDADEKQLKNFKDSLYESYKDVAEASDMIAAELYQHDVADKDKSNLDKIDPLKSKITAELVNRFDPSGTKEKLAWISPVLFKELIADIKLLGVEKFRREIIYLAKGKKQLTYLELKAQFEHDVLEINSYNDNIAGKFFRKDLI